MDIEEMGEVIDSALLQGIIETECPQCGSSIQCASDESSIWCDQCNKVVKVKNILQELKSPDTATQELEGGKMKNGFEREKPIYIIGNPVHPLGFMVASPDDPDPIGHDDPVQALSELGQMRQDEGRHLKLYRVVSVDGPIAKREDLEKHNVDCEIEDFDYSLVEEHLHQS